MQVGIRDFKAHLSAWLTRLSGGESIEITSHRRIVARVQGVPQDAPQLGTLLSSGAAQWQGGKPLGAAVSLSPGGPPLSDAILQDRG